MGRLTGIVAFPMLLAACAKGREDPPPPAPSAHASAPRGTEHMTQLRLVTEGAGCRKTAILCDRTWPTSPTPEEDACFPLQGDPPKPIQEVPAVGRLVHRRTLVLSTGERLVVEMGYGPKTGERLDGLPDCPDP